MSVVRTAKRHARPHHRRDEARARASSLASEAEQLRFLLDEAHVKREAAAPAGGAAGSAAAKEAEAAAGEAAAAALRTELARLKSELADAASSRDALASSRDEAARRASEAEARLEGARSEAARAEAAAAALERRLSEVEGERRRLEGAAAAAEARAEELQRQLRVRASWGGWLAAAEEGVDAHGRQSGGQVTRRCGPPHLSMVYLPPPPAGRQPSEAADARRPRHCERFPHAAPGEYCPRAHGCSC